MRNSAGPGCELTLEQSAESLTS